MDDWGVSVWDTPTDKLETTSQLKFTKDVFAEEEDITAKEFDDMTNFIGQTSLADDDFGDDFGDFGDGDQVGFEGDNDMETFHDADAFQDFPPSGPATWEPLRLDPWPSPTELAAGVDSLLRIAWPSTSSSAFLTDEDIRQVGGSNQVLVTPESRTLYHTLFEETPPEATKSPNWIRSRIRRQHLIALGIPINLDEVMPHANGKSMPAINVTTRPSSAPPGPREVRRPVSGPASRVGTPRPGTPQPTGTTRQPQGQLSNLSALGPPPVLDEAKITKMLDYDSNTLALLPLSTLEGHLNTLKSLTADTSAVLGYFLQVREALQQDAETYNGLIAGLVGEAQKMKSLGNKARSGGKRGSALA